MKSSTFEYVALIFILLLMDGVNYIRKRDAERRIQEETPYNQPLWKQYGEFDA